MWFMLKNSLCAPEAVYILNLSNQMFFSMFAKFSWSIEQCKYILPLIFCLDYLGFGKESILYNSWIMTLHVSPELFTNLLLTNSEVSYLFSIVLFCFPGFKIVFPLTEISYSIANRERFSYVIQQSHSWLLGSQALLEVARTIHMKGIMS